MLSIMTELHTESPRTLAAVVPDELTYVVRDRRGEQREWERCEGVYSY